MESSYRSEAETPETVTEPVENQKLKSLSKQKQRKDDDSDSLPNSVKKRIIKGLSKYEAIAEANRLLELITGTNLQQRSPDIGTSFDTFSDYTTEALRGIKIKTIEAQQQQANQQQQSAKKIARERDGTKWKSPMFAPDFDA